MRLWFKIVKGLIFVAIIGIGATWFEFTEPQRKISKKPVMKEISTAAQPWETRVDLIGSVFAKGQSKRETETILEGAGFAMNKHFKFYFAEDTTSKNDVIWSARQGSNVCNMEWSVISQFDENENLVSADGLVSERGCL